MMHDHSKDPRLYIECDLATGQVVALGNTHLHYLKNVLRGEDGDCLRLFNGRDGEWLGRLRNLTKKSGEAVLVEQIAVQPEMTRHVHLIFAPIKKHRMEWLVEKAVELGATDFHPVVTQNTQIRKLNEERMLSQIIEAAEQCERMDIPVFHAPRSLEDLLNDWQADCPVFVCLERADVPSLNSKEGDVAILIGPEGGFTAEEKELIMRRAKAVSLGPRILRAETAALKALSVLS